MKESIKFQKKQNQTLILVCVNFALFMVLFIGLGYVAWQSAVLVNRLQGDLDRAEQMIANLQERFGNMDVLIDNLVTTSTERFDKSIRKIVQDSDFVVPLERVSEKIAATQVVIEQTGEAIKGLHESVKELNNEEVAKLVSFHILNGLAEGFQKAAENQRPIGITTSESNLSNNE